MSCGILTCCLSFVSKKVEEQGKKLSPKTSSGQRYLVLKILKSKRMLRLREWKKYTKIP